MSTPNLSAVRSMISSRTSSAMGQLRQKISSEAGSVRQINESRAQQAQQESYQAAKSNAKQTLSVVIQGRDPVSVQMPSMSQALREYIRVNTG